ncbi:PREDICTED: uncharacterized protein LOC109133507 [Camelina sativa]|uniref:Uncharacterized protein LOC109133507 n=1 Tax=Camelina sativa TaxID=90675 RepID=A0ABM1RTZ8_CAMSA|nr:PREDICTED: uncharacterized protein LOC109133507 [Camelina sativa]
MNPSVQRVESLVSILPKIWKLEESVVGADLGQDTFQFNFAEEADLQGVLQNGPYHFDGWMISLVKWEPFISPIYPSAINLWVKVAGIPMHLWEIATLEAIGKKIGTIREIDEDSGSICVTVNGFNPLLFKMVVPFESGDEIIVSLEYEKLLGLCDNCFRLTHDMRSCPELNKTAGAQGFDNQADKRGVQRQHGMVKQGVYHNESGWEKPRKYAKRALDFQSYEANAVAGSSGSNQQNRHQGSGWDPKRLYGAVEGGNTGAKRGGQAFSFEYTSHTPPFHLNRKGSESVWPKPLYKAKQVPKRWWCPLNTRLIRI